MNAITLLRKVLRAPRTIFEQTSAEILLRSVAKTDFSKLAQKPHGLPGRLVVSLTSYPPRYKYLYYTLTCILSQTVQADDVILWVSREDEQLIPENINGLKIHGLKINICEDYKSYNKIVHTLAKYPDAFIFTVDDDLYYRPTLIEETINRYNGNPKIILCHRCHRVKWNADGKPAPYSNWEQNMRESAPAFDVFPTGVGGILYPPDSLPKETLDSATFMEICASTDDVWLYWMARRNGSLFQKVGPRIPVQAWPRSQRIGLHRINTQGLNKNDTNISAMMQRFGSPR